MSYRYRLCPDPDQESVMVEHCGQARLVWNTALAQMNAAYRLGARVDWKRWEAELAEARNADGLEWLKNGSSSVQQQALQQLRQAWRNHWSNPAHFGRPRFRAKHRTRDGFVIRDVSVRKLNRKWSAVNVPKVGWVKFRRGRTLGKHGMAHVTRDRRGRWHVSFAAPQTAVAVSERSETSAVGVDRGATTTAATSDGELLDIPQATRKEEQRIKELQRQLAAQTKGSNRRRRTRESIAKTYGRIADRRKDWVEKTSTKLVADNAVIVFERLRVVNMMASASGTIDNPGSNVAAKSGLNAAIAASCWTMLETRTRDKAEAAGRRFISVPAAHTSQRCSRCGHTEKHNRAGKHFACVACGHEDDADINAAKNVLAAGLAVIKRELPTPHQVGPKREPQPTAKAA